MSVEPNFVKIGQNIKIMRIRKGVTQSELAKKLADCPKTSIFYEI